MMAVLAFALVFQGGLVGVAGLQVAAASSWDALTAASICAAHQTGAPDQPSPVIPHKHEHCALCTGFGPSILPAALPAVALPTTRSSLAGAIPFATGPPRSSHRYAFYISRAPPAVG